MTLTRIVILLALALIVMLTVVVLRAETTRVHYEISALERRDAALRQQVRHEELCLHRARSPAALLRRLREIEGDAPARRMVVDTARP